MSSPTVSVIISTYNRSCLVVEAIQSVLNQEYRDFELLVIDDGSTDNTKEAVLSFKDERVKYFYKENGGNASARNFGIKHSVGKYIASLDSDDLWTVDRLSHVEILEKGPHIDVVCCDNFFIDGNGIVLENSKKNTWKLYEGSILKPVFLCKVNPHLASLMLIRRECFDVGGFYEESMRLGEDTDIIMRFAHCLNFKITGDKFYKVRMHDGSQITDASFDIKVESFLAILDKFKVGGKNYEAHKVSPWLLRRSYSVVYFLSGVKCMRELGDLDRAMRYFKKAILKNPFNFKSYKYYFSERRCSALYERAQSKLKVGEI